MFTQSFYSIRCYFFLIEYFMFSIVKMAAKYAEIARVGKLVAGFQQVLLIQNFRDFNIIFMEHQ